MTVHPVLVDPDKSWETIEAEAPGPSLAPPRVLVFDFGLLGFRTSN